MVDKITAIIAGFLMIVVCCILVYKFTNFIFPERAIFYTIIAGFMVGMPVTIYLILIGLRE
jgi:Na+-translocating ferredoxin:NAD+ oxidoreductase RnfE subunit